MICTDKVASAGNLIDYQTATEMGDGASAKAVPIVYVSKTEEVCSSTYNADCFTSANGMREIWKPKRNSATEFELSLNIGNLEIWWQLGVFLDDKDADPIGYNYSISSPIIYVVNPNYRGSLNPIIGFEFINQTAFVLNFGRFAEMNCCSANPICLPAVSAVSFATLICFSPVKYNPIVAPHNPTVETARMPVKIINHLV